VTFADNSVLALLKLAGYYDEMKASYLLSVNVFDARIY
jgi:hypothetical protein